jgi:glycine betaine/choline ABC-type transport system substrate-binding protein
LRRKPKAGVSVVAIVKTSLVRNAPALSQMLENIEAELAEKKLAALDERLPQPASPIDPLATDAATDHLARRDLGIEISAPGSHQ